MDVSVRVREPENDEEAAYYETVMEALRCKAMGESVDEDAFEEAVVILCALQMARITGDIDGTIRQFDDRDYEVRAAYTVETDEISVEINWLDE